MRKHSQRKKSFMHYGNGTFEQRVGGRGWDKCEQEWTLWRQRLEGQNVNKDRHFE